MPYSFAAVLDYKLPTTKLVREVSMDARRFTAQELYDLGTIDVLAEDGAGVFKAARQLALERADLARTGFWGLIKVCLGGAILGQNDHTDADGWHFLDTGVVL